MKNTLGITLTLLRKESGLTQDNVANTLGVTPQAVSKWENDTCCPDIMLLPEIAKLYSVTVDYLFNGETVPEEDEKDTVHENKRKLFGFKKDKEGKTKKALHILVKSSQGDDVDVRVPLSFIKRVTVLGLDIANVIPGANVDLSGIDIKKIIELAESGVIGEIADIQVNDTEHVFICVEDE